MVVLQLDFKLISLLAGEEASKEQTSEPSLNNEGDGARTVEVGGVEEGSNEQEKGDSFAGSNTAEAAEPGSESAGQEEFLFATAYVYFNQAFAAALLADAYSEYRR